MASNNETTTKFKVDISELKKAMQEAKRAVAVANSEFKAVSSSMDDWTKSSDGLGAKLKQLDTTLKSQKTVLGKLEEQYEEVVRTQGEGSKAADDLKIKINNQKAAVNKTQKEITKYEQTLEEVAEAEKTAAKTGKDVAEVLEDVGEEAKDAGDGFTVFKGAVATFAGNAMTSLVDGIKNGISSLANLGEETREYRTELGKLETAFTTAGFTTEAATKTYKELYSVLGDEGQSVEAANMLAKLVDTEEELAEWTNIATGVYGTFGSSLPVESLAEAANETSKTGALTGALADALNWAGVSEEAFQESLDGCTTEQERQALITDTLNGLYSDAAKTYKKNNKSVMDANKAQSDYNDTMAAMGAKIEPVMTSVKEGFNALLQEALKLVEGVDFEAFSGKVEEAFGVLKDDVLPAIKDGFGWIIDNKDIIVAGLAAIAGGFVAFKVASLIQSVTTALQGMSIAQAALNVVMNANPLMLIVTAIGALIAAFVALWNNCDGFREFWINLWDNITSFFKTAWDGIVSFFTETIPNLISNIGTWFSELPSKIWEWLVATALKIGEWGMEIRQKAIDAAKNFIDNVINFFKELPSNLYNWLVETIVKITAWSIEFALKAKEAATNFIDNVITFFKELPSKIWEWLKNTAIKATEWSMEMQNKAKEAAKNFISNAIETIKELPSKIWTWLKETITKVANWGMDMRSKATETAKNFISNAITTIKELPSKIWTWLKETITKVADWGMNLKNKATEAGKNLVTGIVDTVKGLPEKIKTVGKNMIEGLWNGIKDMGSWIKEKVGGFFDDIVGGVKDFFGINSPSKLMADEVGKWIPEGIAVGIDKNAKSVLSSMRDVTTGVVGAARDGITTGGTMSGTAGIVNNFYQTNNSPKALSRLEIYRQSKNLLGYAGGV